MSKVKFFKEIIDAYGQESMDSICPRLELKIYEEDETIVKRGDIGDAFYVIVKGRVSLLILMQMKNDEVKLRELK